MTIAGEQAHALVIPLDEQAVAVVFDLVDPFRAVRNFRPVARDARLFTHSAKIGRQSGESRQGAILVAAKRDPHAAQRNLEWRLAHLSPVVRNADAVRKPHLLKRPQTSAHRC